MFRKSYADVFKGDASWNAIKLPAGEIYAWDEKSTYVQEPALLRRHDDDAGPRRRHHAARACSALLGDSITTDHISPAGNIARPARPAKYLMAHGVQPADFNSYGARRGNHEVMMRGTFANIRLRTCSRRGTEGGVTVHVPSGEQMSIYDAAMRYKQEGTPLVVLAGKEYGTGSSRDWAAKGTMLLGVQGGDRRELRAHPPLQPGRHGRAAAAVPGGPERAQSLGLTGDEIVRDHRPRRRRGARTSTVVADAADGRADRVRGARAASTRRRKPSTTATAASCSTCCASWPPRPRHHGAG